MCADQFDTRRDGAAEPRRRRPRRRAVGIVGAVLVAAAVGAVALGQAGSSDSGPPPSSDARAAAAQGLPDAADAAVVEAALDDDGGVYQDGARLPLDAEKVRCGLPPGSGMNPAETPDGIVVEAAAVHVPYTEAVTAAALATSCADTGIPTPVELRADTATVCATDSTLLPVMTVLLDGRTCAEADARPAEDGDLAGINRARAVEVRLLAVPADGACPTLDQARDWAEAEVAVLPIELTIRSIDEGPGCYRPATYWSQGEIVVQLLGPQPE